jgi:hypothetical protein
MRTAQANLGRYFTRIKPCFSQNAIHMYTQLPDGRQIREATTKAFSTSVPRYPVPIRRRRAEAAPQEEAPEALTAPSPRGAGALQRRPGCRSRPPSIRERRAT